MHTSRNRDLSLRRTTASGSAGLAVTALPAILAAVCLLTGCATQTPAGMQHSPGMLQWLLPLVAGLLLASLISHAGLVASRRSRVDLAYMAYAAAAVTATALLITSMRGPTGTAPAGWTITRGLPGLYLFYAWVMLEQPEARRSPPIAYGVIWVLYGLTVAAALMAHATADALLLLSANRITLLLAAAVFALVPARGIVVRVAGLRLPAAVLLTHMLLLILAPAFVLLGSGLLPLRPWHTIVPPLLIGLEALLTLPTFQRRIVAAERFRSERDLMDRLRFEQRLRAELEQETRHVMLDSVSRETRTLLNSILGFAALLGDTPLSPGQQRHLDGIHCAANSLTNVLIVAPDTCEDGDGGELIGATSPEAEQCRVKQDRDSQIRISPEEWVPQQASATANPPSLLLQPALRVRRGTTVKGTAEMKVLVVDDFEMNREMLHAMLRLYLPFSSFRDARDGIEAVEAYKEFQPDLVLMDVRMPRLDGRNASRKIREVESQSQRHTVIVGLSAGVSVGETERCRTAGMDAVLGKPIDTEALGTVLDRLLETGLLQL